MFLGGISMYKLIIAVLAATVLSTTGAAMADNPRFGTPTVTVDADNTATDTETPRSYIGQYNETAVMFDPSRPPEGKVCPSGTTWSPCGGGRGGILVCRAGCYITPPFAGPFEPIPSNILIIPIVGE